MCKLKKILLLTVLGSSFILLGCNTASNIEDEDPTGEETNGEEEQEIYIPDTTITENLIVVTVDGVRWQEVFKGADPVLIYNEEYIHGSSWEIQEKFSADSEEERREKLMPFFWNELVNDGQIYGNRDYENDVNVTNPSLKSFPGYCEIFNGYADPSITTNKPPINNNLTVLEYLNKQEGFQGNKVAIRAAAKSFEQLFHASQNDFSFSSQHKDSTVFNKTMRLLKNHQPRVMYMSVNKTDHWAHEYQYDTYLNKIHEADSFIRDIWDFVQKDAFYRDRTTLIITTDHGRGVEDEWHTHGSGGVAHADETWFSVIGPDTEPSGEQKDKIQITAIQFAKTMAAFLELHFDTGNAEGVPIKSVMDKTFSNN